MWLYGTGWMPRWKVASVCCADGEGGDGGGGGGVSVGGGGAPAGGSAGGGEAGGAGGSSVGTVEAAPAGESAVVAGGKSAGSSPGSPAVQPAEPARPAWNIPEFDFTDWDGKLDRVPEPLHPVFQGVMEHYSDRLTQAERDRDLYRSFVDGSDGVQQIEAMRATHATELGRREQELDGLRAQVQQFNAFIKQQADEQAAAWFSKHQSRLKDPEFKARVAKLVGEHEVDADTAIVLADQPQEVTDLALYYMKQGAKPEHAARLAMQDSQAPYGNGRKAVEVPPVAGDSPLSQPPLRAPDLMDPRMSAADARKQATREAFREVAGGA